ncbi:MAG: hypothetical protein ACERJ2_13765 [Filomicrobium sp.]
MAQPTEPTDATAGGPDACGYEVTSHALNGDDFNTVDCLAYAAGCAAHVTKPFNSGLLLATIRHQPAFAGT